MEDLYKDDPNSWLRCPGLSKKAYHLSDPSQIPIIPLTELKITPSNPNSNRASMSMSVTGDHTSTTSLESSPDIGLTGTVQVGSGSKTNKSGMASKRRAISEMFKKVKEAVRMRFVAPLHIERTIAKTGKSSSRPKKKSRWLKKYFDRGVRQVGVLDGSSEGGWSPDISELIRWKKMASRVRCPIYKAIQESSEVDISKPYCEDQVGPGFSL